MFKKDDLEDFLFLFNKAERIPFTNYEDAISNNFNALDVPFLAYSGIINCDDYLKTEIKENLLSLNKDDRVIYLEYLQNKLHYESWKFDNEKLIDILKYYNIDPKILDFNENKQLHELLNKSFKSISGDENLIKLRDLHREYYKYLLNIERDKVLKYINNLILMVENKDDFSEKLIWIGKPSQLGYIIGNLAQLGYLEIPMHKSGDINFNQFARLVKQTFQVDTTEATLSKYLNIDSEKGQETDRKFKKLKFNIPHIKEIG